MEDKDEVYIEITSFIGVSIGAKHYYGHLIGYKDGEYTSIELYNCLSAREARKLNRDSWFDAAFREGDMYAGFDTKDDIINLALVKWKHYFPDASILVLGDIAYGKPQEVLVGPEDYKKQINEWAEQFPRGNWTSVSERLSDQFIKYRREYIIK